MSNETKGEPGVRRTCLANGIRLVTEKLPTFQSSALGFWIQTGSRDESASDGGISHFVEHLLFKGTKRRDARAIAEEIETVGGHLNAFTSREVTCYHARVLAEHNDIAVDVLSDVLCNSTFPEAEIEQERTVILAEIAEAEDSPEQLVHQLFDETFWKGGPLGRPICGTRQSVESFQRTDFKRYVDGRYGPDRMVVTAAGEIDHDWLVGAISEAFGDKGPATTPLERGSAESQAGLFVHERPAEQVQLVMGLPAVHATDPRRFAARVLSCALGEGMSSRLFQEVREIRGLAYSIYSFLETHEHAGHLGVYGAMAAHAVPEAVEVIRGIFEQVRREGLEDREITRARNQLLAGLHMGLESTVSRMQRLAMNELYFGQQVELDIVRAEIAKVDAAAIGEVAEFVLNDEALNVTLLGPVGTQRPDLGRLPAALVQA